MDIGRFHRQFLLSTTMLVGAFTGYARQAYAACLPGGGATYLCSGTDTNTVAINANNATVTTQPGFNVTAGSGHALTITGDGALSYTDYNASPLLATGTTHGDDGLYVSSGGDAGAIPGSVSIYTTGSATGINGIAAVNRGSGALTVTAYGAATGTTKYGIYALNNSGSGGDLTITTGTATVQGYTFGIDARNHGASLSITAYGDVAGTHSGATSSSSGIQAASYKGPLTITTYGNVSGAGTLGDGIFAINTGSGDTTITTAAGKTVSGGGNGIFATNVGSGALTINAYGAATGTKYDGIRVYNDPTGGDVKITTGTGTIQGGYAGIYAVNYGNSLSITTHGDVSGTGGSSTSSGIAARNHKGALSITTYGTVNGAGANGDGIYAKNYAGNGDVTITTAAGKTVSGGKNGIEASNYGHGALTINAYGAVTGTGNDGIRAYNAPTGGDAKITTGTDTVQGKYHGIFASNHGNSLSITTHGDVAGTGTSVGYASGIWVYNFNGALTITTYGNVSGAGASGDGIFANNSSNGDATITTAAGKTVYGGGNGINALNTQGGALTINAYGAVTGASGFGIKANNNSATGGDLKITTGTYAVQGGSGGIYARNSGKSLTIVAHGDVLGTANTGPHYINSGIVALNHKGTLTITTYGNVAGAGSMGDGIYAYNSGGDATITTGVGKTVYGRKDGIEVYNGGGGALTINANGDVTGKSSSGIYALNGSTGGDAKITTGMGTVKGNHYGIYAKSDGNSLSITTHGNVTGVGLGLGTYYASGVWAKNYKGALSITADGDVTGGGSYGAGIYAYNGGYGDTTITTTAGSTVSGGGFGIRAVNYYGNSLAITAHGNVYGTGHASKYDTNSGIYALNYNGAVTIATYGNVDGAGSYGNGIFAYNSDGGSTVTITTAAGTTVSGGYASGVGAWGIGVRNYGSGGTTITANGDVVAYGTGAAVGIIALNKSGALSITANGAVTGNTGIYAFGAGVDSGTGTSLSITTGSDSTVTGTTGNGITAIDVGAGALAIDVNGNVYAIGKAISATSTGTDLTVTTGAGTSVRGVTGGIIATNFGSGALTITANGDVFAGGRSVTAATSLTASTTVGVTATGIFAFNKPTATSLTVTTGVGSTVTGSGYANAIDARNYGSGATKVAVYGNVYSTGSAGNGINAANGAYSISGGTDLTVITGPGTTVLGGNYGILAGNHGGTGNLAVTVNGDVTGANGGGIMAVGGSYTGNTGGDITVTTAAGTIVSGARRGIIAYNTGPGAVTVKAYGAVTGTAYLGIGAANLPNGTSVSVTTGTGAVSGGNYGIHASNYGSGALTVTTGGNVVATAAGGYGIHANNGRDAKPGGTDLTITTAAGTTVSGSHGILATNFGSGALTVTANGDVNSSGTLAAGIAAFNNFYRGSTFYGYTGTPAGAGHGNGTDLTVTTGPGTTVYGYYNGIVARNYGSGALTVTANGDVKSTALAYHGLHGIEARNSGTDLTISTAAGTTVFGFAAGIFAENHGSGALTIMPGGDVASTTTAISAYNYGTDLNITTGPGTLTGNGSDGIDAINQGSGHLKIVVGGDVTGKSNGINASNGLLTSAGTDLSVTTAAGTTVSGGAIGIGAFNGGTGALTVMANGDVKSTSTTGFGIDAYNKSYSTGNLTVTTGMGSTVYGGIGINALNDGSGGLKVDVNGDVSGSNAAGAGAYGAGAGVYGFNSNAGTYLAITVANGGTVSSNHGAAVAATQHGSGPVTITVGATSAVTSTGTGANSYGIKVASAAGLVTVAGRVNGGSAGAISFDQNTAFNDTLVLVPGFSISGNVMAGPGTDTLVFGGTGGSGSFDVGSIGPAAQYQSFERFFKEGSSHWVLTGTNTTIPGFTIDNGLLSVNASMPNTTFTVNAGGTLGGDGTIGATTINGGTLAPGNSIGELVVNGNLTVTPGSVYAVQIDSAGNSDRVHATGTATINGGNVEVIPYPDYSVGTRYTIVIADGGLGGAGFDGAAFKTPSLFMTPKLSSDANDVYLVIAKTANFKSVAQTPNQTAAANGAESVHGGPLFDAIGLLGNPNEARGAFDAISGEIHASADTALVEDSRFVRQAAEARFHADFEDAAQTPALAYAGNAGMKAMPGAWHGTAFWAQAIGSTAHTGSDGNAAAMNHSTNGILMGADAIISQEFRLGILGGYTNSSLSVNDRASSGSADNWHVGAYAGGKWGKFSMVGGAAYSWHDLNTHRSVAFTGFTDTLSAAYKATTAQIFAETSYRFDTAFANFEPYGKIAYVHLNTGGFTETGGAAALTGRSRSANTTFTTLGLRMETEFAPGDGTSAKLTSGIGWRHAFGDMTPRTQMAFTGGNVFTIAGVPIARDALMLDLGADIALSRTATFSVSYSGQIASRANQQDIVARFSESF